MDRLKLSNSQLELWAHSRRCFWWRYIRGIASMHTSEHMTWGSAVHKGLEYLFEGINIGDTVGLLVDEECFQSLEYIHERGSFFTPELLHKVLDKYACEHLDDFLENYEILETEHSVTRPVGDVTDWRGVFDLVTIDKRTDKIVIWDHKTTGKKVDGSYYAAKFDTSQQITGYWWLGHYIYGDAFDGVRINAIQTTKTIHGKCAQLMPVRDDWQLEEFVQNVNIHGPEILDAKQQGQEMLEAGLDECSPEVAALFPMAWSYSENFCDYHELNSTPPSLREPMIEYDYEPYSSPRE